jgi:hypothetical protein
VGKVSKARKLKKKQKPGGGRGENKVHKKIRGKKYWEGGGEKIKLKKKLRSGLRKGKQKNSTWDGTGFQWLVLVHSGLLNHGFCGRCSVVGALVMRATSTKQCPKKSTWDGTSARDIFLFAMIGFCG